MSQGMNGEREKANNKQERQYVYRMHEGAILRGPDKYGFPLEVWFPRSRRWAPYDNRRDWHGGREISTEDAERLMAMDATG